MSRRILMLSPWGVEYMDQPALDVASKHVRPDTELEVRNLGSNAPQLPWPVASAEGLAVEAARKAEADGFDGIVIVCCADPFLEAVRAAVNIPVTGLSEATIATAKQYGKVGIMARRLSDDYLPLIPSQGNWDFWNNTALKNGLKEGQYALHAVEVPKHPSPEDLDRLTEEDPAGVRDLTVEAMREALLTNGVRESRLAVEDGVDALYFACAYWSRGIDELGDDAELFDVPIINPVVAGVGFLEHALVARGK